MKSRIPLLLCSIVLLLGIYSCQAQNDVSQRKAEDNHGLAVGDDVPEVKGLDQNGASYDIQEDLVNGPVVIVFYRGQWCPYCNEHLSNLQDSLNLIESKGATVIAISPEVQEYLTETQEKTGASFTLVTDVGYRISDAFSLTFDTSTKERFLYNAIGAKLKKAHTSDEQKLPIPATYIIGQDGKVKWRHFDPDYSLRSTAKEILEQL